MARRRSFSGIVLRLSFIARVGLTLRSAQRGRCTRSSACPLFREARSCPVVATTPVGATGTFWIGDFTFTPEVPLTPGYFTAAVLPLSAL